jgi:molybdenum cofactor cytidylyltransferase
MGQDKLLMPWGDATVVESILASWRESKVDDIVVVTRRDQAELRKLCGDAIVVACETDPPEMKDSVRAALNHIQQTFSPADQDVWLLAPADMPQLDATVTDTVLAAHNPSAPSIIVPVKGDKRGHPVLFPWALAAIVEQLSDDEGVNALLKRHPVRRLECDSTNIHGDLDTPEDYQRLHGNTGQGL